MVLVVRLCAFASLAKFNIVSMSPEVKPFMKRVGTPLSLNEIMGYFRNEMVDI
jgi:hypothetical protein